MTPVVLITAQPRNATTAVATTIRLAGGGNRKPYFYGANHFRAGVSSLVRFRGEIGFDENGWTGFVAPTTGAIAWAPAGKAGIAELGAFHWKGAAITVEEGDEATATFATRLTGKIEDIEVRDHKLLLTVADLAADLSSKPLVKARFLGTGGIEGGAEAKGRAKRRTFGRTFNIEGRVFDKLNNIYEFGDPSFPWQSIDTLRDIGRDAVPAPTVLAWQGSVSATLIALKASSPAEGSGVVAPSIACCKWWIQPAGPLTADVHGEIGTGYVETVASIAERILVAASGPTVTNVAAANGWRPDVAGIHVAEDETPASALDRLLMGVSLVWFLDPAGTVTFREITFSAPVETLASDNAERLRSFRPVKTRRVGYQKAYRSHSDGEIAAVLLEAGASFIQADPPSALDSAPDAHWLDSDDSFKTYVRVPGSGFLQLDGGALILDGRPVELAWTAVPVGPAEMGKWSTILDDDGFRPEDDADLSGDIIGPAEIFIQCDSAGNIISGQLDQAWQFRFVEKGVDVGSGITWARSLPSGITTVISGTGTLTLSCSAFSGDVIEVELSAARVGRQARKHRVRFIKVLAAPPTGGGSGGGTGGGAQSQTSGFTAVSSGTAAVISQELQVVVGSGAQATFAASLSIRPTRASPIGSWVIRLQWERWNGSSWVTQGSTFDASAGVIIQDGDGIYLIDTIGQASNSQNYASSNGATVKMRLTAWIVSGSSTNTTKVCAVSGQISLQG